MGFCLSAIRNLQQLTISTRIYLDHRRLYAYNFVHLKNYSALPAICQLLSTSPPSLTHLTLYPQIHCRSDCDTRVLSTVDWQPLVEVLCSPSLPIRRTCLDIFLLDYDFSATRTISCDQLIQTVHKSMDITRLVEQGALVIQAVMGSSSR
jgi:hypothetical protein